MPDISMCMGDDCPKKEGCYRYRAIPWFRQSYFSVPPYDGEECRYFWPLEGQRIRSLDDIEKNVSHYDVSEAPDAS